MLSLCVCVKLLYVTFGYVKLLYVKFVRVKLLYVKLLYVKFLCVGGGGRREEEAEEEEKPGIQNQKQEPHTKMWGKTQTLTTSLHLGYTTRTWLASSLALTLTGLLTAGASL